MPARHEGPCHVWTTTLARWASPARHDAVTTHLASARGIQGGEPAGRMGVATREGGDKEEGGVAQAADVGKEKARWRGGLGAHGRGVEGGRRGE